MGGTPLSDKFYSSLKADSRVEEPSETDMKTFMKTNPKLRPENYPKIKPTTLAVTKPTHRHEHKLINLRSSHECRGSKFGRL